MKKKCIWLLFLTLVTAELKFELRGEFKGIKYPMLYTQQTKNKSLYIHSFKESISKANPDELKLFGVTPSLIKEIIQSHVWFFYRKAKPPILKLDLSKIIKVIKVKSANVISVTPLAPVDITGNFQKFHLSVDPAPIYNNITSIWVGSMPVNETIRLLVGVKGLVLHPVTFAHRWGEKLWECFAAPSFVLFPKEDLKTHSADEYIEAKILAFRAAIVLQIDYQISLAGLVKCNHMEGMSIDKLMEEKNMQNKYTAREMVNLNVFYRSKFAEIVPIY